LDRTVRILVVDDDERAVRLLTRYLSKSGYEVDSASNGDEMYECIRQRQPDLILLDLELPGKHGLDLARDLRGDSDDVGIIIVTGSGVDIDMIVGLEIGADDYIQKPFDNRALLARIRSVLRRIGQRDPAVQDHNIARFANFSLDLTAHKLVDESNREILLTGHEFQLLEYMVSNANRVLSRDQIMDSVNDRDWLPSDRSVDVLISKLRKKLEADPAHPEIIKTMRSFGYIMTTRIDFSD